LRQTRRQFLARGAQLATAGLLASVVAKPVWAQQDSSFADEFWMRPRTIRFRHASGERIEATYWSNGEIIRPAYDELSWFMRDRVAHKGVWMNPVLFDIAYGIEGWLDHFGLRRHILLTSGHRDAVRNTTIEGAVRNSLHITGDAMDIRIEGISSQKVAQFGVWLGGGGVGWYPRKDFTHLDRGRLRAWRG
jgi:uncharacterized protein YcbK (DUF882 family)